MDVSPDVVVVGGGIAGAALAKATAEAGRQVMMLERQMTYRDKVRGEVLSAWGVVEAAGWGLRMCCSRRVVRGRRTLSVTTRTRLPPTPRHRRSLSLTCGRMCRGSWRWDIHRHARPSPTPPPRPAPLLCGASAR